VIDEVSDRTRGHVRGIADFLELRRLTAGAYASFFSVELGLDVPDEVMEHPAVEALRSLAGNSTVLVNVRWIAWRHGIWLILGTRIFTHTTTSKLRDMAVIISSLSWWTKRA
jgi:hypothetical protein